VEDTKDGTLELKRDEKVVVLSLEVTLNERAHKQAMAVLEAVVDGLKGLADVASGRSRVHELAAATQAYFKAKGQFPPGALDRPPSSERGFDWRPDQRLSWVADLLPYFDGDYGGWKVNREFSWNEGPNLALAHRVVPQVLARRGPNPGPLEIQYPGMAAPVAATHFVGVAGVGLDAAEYKAGDAATAKKLGVFGFHRVTRKQDLKDNPAETIVLLQVPGDHKAPWLAGGGSTVRGVSEDADAVQPFVCTTYPGKRGVKTKWDGKPGTVAVMADGRVRFIPADIDPDVFRAMCTIAGGERIERLNEIAPEIASAEETELKATGPAGKPPAPGPGPSAKPPEPVKPTPEPPKVAPPPPPPPPDKGKPKQPPKKGGPRKGAG
jgi:hypothetical protein